MSRSWRLGLVAIAILSASLAASPVSAHRDEHQHRHHLDLSCVPTSGNGFGNVAGIAFNFESSALAIKRFAVSDGRLVVIARLTVNSGDRVLGPWRVKIPIALFAYGLGDFPGPDFAFFNFPQSQAGGVPPPQTSDPVRVPGGTLSFFFRSSGVSIEEADYGHRVARIVDLVQSGVSLRRIAAQLNEAHC